MSLPLLAILTLAGLALAYRFYGRFIARQFRLDDAVPTPAQQVNDGADYVPTKPFYLLGQHFSAIAAAGPIVGPIAACMQFGWIPCLIWIGLGAVFIGAVHDFSALAASVRHKARSIAEIVRLNLSRRAWLCLLAFIWIALVYVIVAFTNVTAGTFLGRIEELGGVKVGFERGGAVAFASTAYLTLALIMGLIQRKWNPPLWLMTLVFVPATLGVVWLGTKCSTIFVIGGPNAFRIWGAIILGYCFIASLLPVWSLLQPRGYLGGFILYMALAIAVAGIFAGGFTVQQPGFKGWVQTDPQTGAATPTGLLFPFLFVTIACGACSGFHGLVCGGTTSKQIAKETHCRPVGYGAMLLEGFVAVIALTTIMVAVPKAGAAPGAIYGEGIGRYLAAIIGEQHLVFAIVFGSMAFSTFVFDTLDVATRLGRYILQELFDSHARSTAAMATLVTIGAPLVFVLAAEPNAWLKFWVLFGSSNQLLAALTLLGVTVWLARSGRTWWYTAAPMAFVMIITVWALVRQAWTGVTRFRSLDGSVNSIALINGTVSIVLMALAGLIVIEAVRAVRRPVAAPAT
jgi:carbon starvation protein